MSTSDTILSLFDDCDFDDLCGGNYLSQIIQRINFNDEFQKDDMWYDTGATKLAIGWDNQDWVIKIPFCGLSEEEDYYREEGEECSDEDVFYRPHMYFEGASNGYDEWDYCRKEYENYLAARDRKVAEVFAEVQFVGKAQGHYPIYRQRKIDSADISYQEISSKSSKNEKDFAHHLSRAGNTELSPLQWTVIIHQWGERVAERLNAFLWEFDINDLHGANVGAINGKFVLMDFSGYND